MKPIRVLFTLLFVLAISGKIFSQDAEEIVNKYIHAIGGLENIQAIKTIKLTGKVTAGGMDIPFTQTCKRPQMVLMESTIQGMTMKQAFDGIQGWTINPFMGKKDPDVMSKDAAKAIQRNADFEGQLINYKDKGSKIELIGKEDLGGSQVYNIKLTDKNNDTTSYYIDADSYLVVKQNDKLKFDTKEIFSESILSNYKQVNGVMFPFSIESKSPDNPMGSAKIIVESIEINNTVDDSIFKMPLTK
jgi:hypothetical protein